MSVRIKFDFIPFPLAIVDDGLDLSLGEYRLLGYLLRHRFRAKTDAMRIKQDELLRGVYAPNGMRRDRGCGITSGRDLRAARKALEDRGWVKVSELAEGVLLYELSLSDGSDDEPEQVIAEISSPGAKCTQAEKPGAKCTHAPGAFCSVGGCILSPSRVQNAPAYKEEKVKKVEEVILPLPPTDQGPSVEEIACAHPEAISRK